MTAYFAHFIYEFRTGLRNSSLLLMNYLFPLGFYAVMGAVMTKINPGFTELLIPAMVILTAMTSTVLGMPGTLVELRESGVFRSFRINGVPEFNILSIPAVSTSIHALIVSVIIVLTGHPLFGGIAPTNWAAFFLITLASLFTFSGFGTLIGVLSSNSRTTVLFSQLIFLPSILLGGMMMPLSVLPESFRPISLLLPTTHLMQAFQGFAFGQQTLLNPTISLIIPIVSGLLAYGLSIYLFNWDSRNQSRRGHPLLGLLVMVPYVISIFVH
jgi:ABC-2 type transport system permease protein